MISRSPVPPSGRLSTAPESDLPSTPSFWQRIGSAWVRLTGPKAQLFSTSATDQERLRRSRLLCALFTLTPFSILFTIPIALTKPTYWFVLVLLTLLSIFSVFLNRRGQVTASGVLFIFSINLTLIVLLTTQPHGLRNGNIPDFDLFVASILIAGSILPRIYLPFLAVLNSAIIVAIFTYVPHDMLLTQEILVNQKGLGYAELSDAFLLQIAGATIAYLTSWSVNRALARANRAEELAETRARLNEQQQRELEQKQRLEYGINVLKEVQARVANGDYSARARLQDNELVPLAYSFNLMTERLSRGLRSEQKYQQMELALQQLLEMRTAIAHGTPHGPLRATGTIVDHLYPLIDRFAFQAQLLSESNSSVERIATTLQQQKSELTRLDAILLQARTQVQQSRLQPRQTSSTLYLERSLTTTLDEAYERYNRINELSKQSLQETRQLGQWIKSA